MKTWIILGCVCLIVQVQSIQQNVTKRGVHDQISYYPDPTPLRYIQVSASNVHPSNFYTNTNHASDYPKQVTVQQVLYDYPHDTPDHVQSSTTQYLNQPQVPIATPIQHPHTAIATPVQHGTVVHHGQSYSRILHPYPAPAPAPIAPAPVAHINPHIYTYNNGKILYQPQRTNPNLHPLPQHPPPVVTQKPFKASPLISTTYYKPVMKNIEEYDEDRRKPANAHDEDNEPEQENYEEEEDEFKPYKSSKYNDSDDDDDENAHYRVQEDDEDERFSRNVRKPGSKKYSTNNKPKSHYKTFKYSTNSKPKKEIYESRQSQNIPIVHKQSFRQEKWIVTKKD